MKRYLTLLFLFGCAAPKPYEPPRKSADIVIRVRPVIIGERFTEVSVAAKMADLAKAHTQTGIRWEVLPTDRITNPTWRFAIVTDAAGVQTPLGSDMSASAKGYFDRGEAAVFFCDKVTTQGVDVGGCAYLPPNHGCWIGPDSCSNVCSHELGHWLALNHTEPITGPGVACLIMSYTCRRTEDCYGQTFTESQISTQRAAATTHRRNACEIMGTTARLKILPPPSATGELVVCPR